MSKQRQPPDELEELLDRANEIKRHRMEVAQFLIRTIAKWGGQKQQIADRLKLSNTTTCHLGGAPSGQSRSYVVASEHICALEDMLDERIRHNLDSIVDDAPLGYVVRMPGDPRKRKRI